MRSLGIITGIILSLLIMYIIFSSTTLTGNVTKCSVECYKNSDCNDNIEGTLDWCKYPGECNSTCKHEDISFLVPVG